MCIIVKSLSYIHPHSSCLLSNISFSVDAGKKVALVGNNGVGKSTLLKIIAGLLRPAAGQLVTSSCPYYVPQHTGQFDHLTVAGALGIEKKLVAMHQILQGNASVENLQILADEWGLEERAKAALAYWGGGHLGLKQLMGQLSGGEKTKVFLSGISVYSPRIILFDEPSNHLDKRSRQVLYDFIRKNKSTMLVAGHDRDLLDLLDTVIELNPDSVDCYGGNYTFYDSEKERMLEGLHEQLESRQSTLNKARQKQKDLNEQRQRMEIRNNLQVGKKGLPKIVMGGLKRKAQTSSAHLKEVQGRKIEDLSQKISILKEQISKQEILKVKLSNPETDRGRNLVRAENLNFSYSKCFLWKTPLTFAIRSSDRIRIEGNNGSGKSTLIKIMTEKLQPTSGKISVADFTFFYIDQEYSLLDNTFTVIEQVEKFNDRHLSGSELRTLLHRHQFSRETWNKETGQLSGGEKLKLLLCCITVKSCMPEVIILDEPTNNLDVNSQEVLTIAIRKFTGTLILISHDDCFAREVRIDKQIVLD